MYDILIVGSGAGGSTAFLELTDANKVLLVEEGTSQSNLSMSVAESMRKSYRDSAVRPAFGYPSVAIGEGKCLGGSTEVNGGLFWRTPEFILETWRKLDCRFAKSPKLPQIFDQLEAELHVISEELVPNRDLDSLKLLEVCERKGLKITAARRMVKNCAKTNMCPSGCPSGAKQTMSRTFLPKGIAKGGEVLTGWKAIKVKPKAKSVTVEFRNPEGLRKVIEARKLVVACGAIESRRLLARSGLLKSKIGRIGFHSNLKIIVEYPGAVHANLGTIFTHQLQEYINDGFLLMASNFNETFLAFGSSALSPSTYLEVRNNLNKYSMYTAQFKVESKLIDIPIGFNKHILLSYFPKSDRAMIRKYLQVATELLFQAGAKSICLPVSKSKPVFSIDEAKTIISRSGFGKFSISTVHLMSSIPINPLSKEINQNGSLTSSENVFVLDASILPTTVGESPQGTIMALIRYLLRTENAELTTPRH